METRSDTDVEIVRYAPISLSLRITEDEQLSHLRRARSAGADDNTTCGAELSY